jgi:hypothetical protein
MCNWNSDNGWYGLSLKYSSLSGDDEKGIMASLKLIYSRYGETSMELFKSL